LTLACRNGKLNIVEYLIDMGASVNINYARPLLEALIKGDFNVLAYLYKHGASPLSFGEKEKI